MANLFALQPQIKALLESAVGDQAVVYTAYDLARAEGQLSAEPAVYLLLDGMSLTDRRREALALAQRWEVSVSVPVSVSDRSGEEAMELIGQLAYAVLAALHSAQLPSVRSIDFESQTIQAGLVGNRLVIPFAFSVAFVQPIV